MDVWVSVFLFVHVMGAIVAFGPTYIFPLIAAASRRDPQHAHFGAGVSELISKRVVFPFALLQGVTGVILILLVGFDLTASSSRWLISGIVLYLIAILISIFVMQPSAERMVELTASPPPMSPEGRPMPSPELLATGRRLQLGGTVNGILVAIVVLLMVTKPSF